MDLGADRGRSWGVETVGTCQIRKGLKVRTRLSDDVRRAVILAANEEVRRLGDRRVGTQHLLLALLHEPDSLAQRILGMDLDSARSALTDLDRDALRAIGIDPSALDRPISSPARRKPPFTTGFRAVLVRAVTDTRANKESVVSDHRLLRALLEIEPPDPAAALLAAMGVDNREALNRLESD